MEYLWWLLLNIVGKFLRISELKLDLDRKIYKIERPVKAFYN